MASRSATCSWATRPAPSPAEWHPISLQYRPYTADGENVRKESLNPEDEFGVYENRSYFGASTFATNKGDLGLVLAVREALPADAKLIVAIRADRPMCFYELEPSCDAIVLGFTDGHGAFPEIGLANIITGKAEPSGLLPAQMPIDMDTVEANLEGVPLRGEQHAGGERLLPKIGIAIAPSAPPSLSPAGVPPCVGGRWDSSPAAGQPVPLYGMGIVASRQNRSRWASIVSVPS